MSENQECIEKWWILESKYQSNKAVLEAAELSKIEGLLNHEDLEYIKQGWQLLLSVGVEQICRYVKMEDGDYRVCGDFQDRDFVERGLLESLFDYDELIELYDLGSFDRMEWPIFQNIPVEELNENQKEKVLRRSQEMVLIPSGSFMMGALKYDDGLNDYDEKPRHEVTLSRDFWMGKYPVTQSLWESVMGNNPSEFKGSNRPVENVYWFDVVDFCNKLSLKEGLNPVYGGLGDYTTGDSEYFNGDEIETLSNQITMNQNANGYRLPTEAEWEYAARGGEYHLYAGSNNIDEVAWYGEDWNSGSTHPVGQKKANDFGLYDMSGNVWEWCWDWYGFYSSNSVTDPTGPNIGSRRVFRGGSWNSFAGDARVSSRYGYDPALRGDDLGFRLSRFVQ